VVNLGIIDREEVKPETISSDGTTLDNGKSLPSIDLEILFDYDSDDIRGDQYQKLIELSNTLKSPDFKSYKFALLGHSDAKGAAAYNIDLSNRRAQSVSTFLSNITGISNAQFVHTGLGSQKLKTPSDPFGEKNRRVQLVLVPVK